MARLLKGSKTISEGVSQTELDARVLAATTAAQGVGTGNTVSFSTVDAGTECYSDNFEAKWTAKGQASPNVPSAEWTTMVYMAGYGAGVYHFSASVNANYAAYGASCVICVGEATDGGWTSGLTYGFGAAGNTSNGQVRVSGSEAQYYHTAGAPQATFWKLTRIMETGATLTGDG